MDDAPTLAYLNRIIQGDCMKELVALGDESIDLTLFSPPYDGIRDYKKNWSFDVVELGAQLYRVTKNGGVVVAVVGDGTRQFAKSLSSFRMAVSWVDTIGWKLFECVIYHRDGNPGAWWKQRFRVDHEYVLIFFKGARPKTFQSDHMRVACKHAGKRYTKTNRMTNGGLMRIDPQIVRPSKCRGTVWRYASSNAEGNRIKLQHPATFPDKLAEDIILCFSQPGEVVLDPMCGSGTTCVVAQNLNRSFIGIEISPEYCAIAERRLVREYRGAEQTALFPPDMAVDPL